MNGNSVGTNGKIGLLLSLRTRAVVDHLQRAH